MRLGAQERGWKEWPGEDWFVSGAGEMLRRPKDAKKCDFCNCASYSGVVVDVPGSVKRVMLSRFVRRPPR